MAIHQARAAPARVAIGGVLVGALACGSCDGARPAEPADGPPLASSTPPLAPPPSAAQAQGTSTPPLADAAPSATAAQASVGTIELQVTVLAEPTIGRPGPGVVPVAVDPRYVLRVRVDQVKPEAAEEFVRGSEVALGMHSPSRTFPGGVAQGGRARLRIHWRQPDGGKRRYFHIEQIH